jgi:hypothetical protein
MPDVWFSITIVLRRINNLMNTKKRELKTRRNAFKPWLVAGFCLLLLGVFLLLAACGSYYQSPSSPPNNGTPQATPTNGGYSIIYLVDKEMQALVVPYR